MVGLEVLAPFCISSPQSLGKGTRSPPGKSRVRAVLSPNPGPCCPLSPCSGLWCTGGEGGGHRWREALSPHGPEPSAIEGGGKETLELIGGDASREQDFLGDRGGGLSVQRQNLLEGGRKASRWVQLRAPGSLLQGC